MHLTSLLHAGFHKKSLLQALATLTENAASPPVGLILGAGFEDQPNLIDQLENHYTLLGNNAQTVALSKDPAHLLALLKDKGIPHPLTTLTKPQNPEGWIEKRIGGSGGIHICPCSPSEQTSPKKHVDTSPKRYFQRTEIGIPLSVSGVVSSQSFAIGICRQWCSPTSNWPYRFGGIVSPVNVNPDTEARMIDVAVELTRALGLKGFVSFDFLATKNDVLFLEVNPRPSAALDILDDKNGQMFKAHLAACKGQDPTAIITPSSEHKEPTKPARSQAIAYLYADQGQLEIPEDFHWPSWSCDRPMTGTRIKRYRPLVTVTAKAENDIAAENLCRKRLGELERMLYGPGK